LKINESKKQDLLNQFTKILFFCKAMQTKIVLIEASSNLGLKRPSLDKEPGVKFFSKALLDTGFAEILSISEIKRIEPPVYTGYIDPEASIRNAVSIQEYSKKLAKAISQSMHESTFQLVVGGDCSILIGCALALKAKGNFGLVFLDGHTDYMLPEHSGTHGAAGMDLALVTGNGPALLSNIQSLSPYIEEENVYSLANRELTEWYVDIIKKSNIHYFDLVHCRKKKWSNLAQSYLDMVAEKQLDGFWIHFDVDALSDEIMPCVDSRQPDGMSYAELQELFSVLLSSPLCAGMDITIYDPDLDETKKYIQNFSTTMQKLLREKAQ
jgi:arginase